MKRKVGNVLSFGFFLGKALGDIEEVAINRKTQDDSDWNPWAFAFLGNEYLYC
ncbi:hypothetical protein [uncultured Sphaerochaeta sp.]|uniref:hypothetical protein n=1 Tax=uncultured Sphaerochaeta sp. TaxID=886478 RepID=UPI002A0A8167|nr:hypothetical protein [uncultured Sphaerochaeta sp.]